jgi:hypothetical protein
MANRGGPGNPLKQSEIVAKFSTNAMRMLSESGTQRLAVAIEQLEGQALRELLALTSASARS